MRRVFIGLAMVSLVGCSLSENMKDVQLCNSHARSIIDQRIAACGRLLATTSNPQIKSRIYANRGMAYGASRRFDLAIADFSQAINLTPSLAATYYLRGLAYSQKDLNELAIADYTKAIALRPDVADTYIYRGIALARTGALDPAIADFKRRSR
jgi:lipoprotein NlpI